MSDPLYESGSAVANAAGVATVRLQALRAHETWAVTRMTVSSTSTVLTPTCRVYRGSINPSCLVDGTYTGTLDQSDTNLGLANGEAIVAVWEGADVGSQCTFTLQGVKEGR